MKHLLRKPLFILIQAEIPCKWVDDSQRFLLEHFDAIQDSPSHIYHSALPLCPASSWLHKCYSMELSQEVKVVKGLPAGWGMCLRTVCLGSIPCSHASWKDLVVVGLESHNIIVLDAITGVYLSVLSGHTDMVRCVTFSSDGTFLISGDWSGVVKLWDVQTGGLVRSLDGHVKAVDSVSISPDHTMIASGSWDKTIHLWNTWTGECHCVIDGHNDIINSVSFSPTNSQLLIVASNNGIVRQWDVHGHHIGPAYEGKYVVFSLDGTLFASWVIGGSFITVWSSNPTAILAKIYVSNDCFCCQFSPDGKLVACGVEDMICIWDITSSTPHLIGTFIGHTDIITSITFSPSLISSSDDETIKFWQFSTTSINLPAGGSQSTSLTPSLIKFVSVQIDDGIAISVDSAGGVRSWDILTGLCRATFQAPALMDPTERDLWGVQLTNGRLILAQLIYMDHLHIWDSEEGHPQVLDVLQKLWVVAPKISRDGSKVFLLIDKSIQVFSVLTGEVINEVWLEGDIGLGRGGWPCYDPLTVDGLRVWVHFKDSSTQGWDFEISGSAPIPLSNVPPGGPHLELSIRQEGSNPYRIKDKVTGNDVFQLSGRYGNPAHVQWDSGYLVAGYKSGEVIVLDFNHMLPQQEYVVCWPSHSFEGWEV